MPGGSTGVVLYAAGSALNNFLKVFGGPIVFLTDGVGLAAAVIFQVQAITKYDPESTIRYPHTVERLIYTLIAARDDPNEQESYFRIDLLIPGWKEPGTEYFCEYRTHEDQRPVDALRKRR